jgi:hypothetical protein
LSYHHKQIGKRLATKGFKRLRVMSDIVWQKLQREKSSELVFSTL